MNTIDDLITKIRENGHDLYVKGPSNKKDIEKFERKTNLSLPPSYREFALKYGYMEIYDDSVDEVSGLLELTEDLREQSDLPDGFIAISMHENGAYCLDFSRQRADGECPVVNYEHSTIQHEKPVSATFHEWLLKFFLEGWGDETA